MNKSNMPVVSSAPADMIWANLLHLSYNMWLDRSTPEREANHTVWKPYLRLDEKLWKDVLQRSAEAGMNMIVLDVGDGVKYESHPEIAVRGAWSPAKLRKELTAMRALGLEPIPKLNFSTGHDAWLGKYSRMVSTDAYYAVCRDLIEEVIGLFDRPRLFHLGMDEETAHHQRDYAYAVIRQHELWWHDLRFYVQHVEKNGSRAWVWSDYLWHHPELFYRNMPKSVLQSNWYYGRSFSRKLTYVQAYLDLQAHGYDQVPTGSNWSNVESFPRTVSFCRRHIAPKRLKGFLQCSWKPTLESCRPRHMEAIEAACLAIAKWPRKS